MTTTDLRPDPCLFEPLLANANVTITITSTRSWAIDPNTGNYTSDVTVPITVRACLVKKERPSQMEMPGIDEKNHVLVGFLVDTKELPEGTNHLTEAIISFDDGYFAGIPRTGKCRLWIPIQNTFVQNELGIKLLVELVES